MNGPQAHLNNHCENAWQKLWPKNFKKKIKKSLKKILSLRISEFAFSLKNGTKNELIGEKYMSGPEHNWIITAKMHHKNHDQKISTKKSKNLWKKFEV